MYAVEFQTTVENGIIKIPIEYQEKFRKSVRVILLAEDAESTESYIDKLLAQPLEIEGFRPLSREEIYER